MKIPRALLLFSVSALLTSTTLASTSTTTIDTHPIIIHSQIPHTPMSIAHPTHIHHIPTPTCTQTIKPDKNGYVPPNTCGSLYEFYPSFGAAIAFSFFFGIVTIAHIAQAVVYKKKFCWVIIMGAAWELCSFVTRSLSTRNQQSTGLTIISQLLVLLAPLWINAFDYMVLARMVHFFIPSHSLFRVKASTFAVTFVSLDIVSFVIQLVGGGMANHSAPLAQQMHGIHIYMGGIGLQEFFIVVFAGMAVKFHMEMLRKDKIGVLAPEKQGWRRLLFTLYGSLVLITIRIIFRLTEYSGGNGPSNPLPYHESYFYVFEAVPMFFALLAMNITHPGTVLTGADSEIPSSKLWEKICCCCCRRRRSKKFVNDEILLELPPQKGAAEISVARVPEQRY